MCIWFVHISKFVLELNQTKAAKSTKSIKSRLVSAQTSLDDIVLSMSAHGYLGQSWPPREGV